MIAIETRKLSRSDELKLRILTVKRHMPKKYMKVILENHPNLNTVEDRFRIGNVVSLKCADESIINIIESLFLPKKKSKKHATN